MLRKTTFDEMIPGTKDHRIDLLKGLSHHHFFRTFRVDFQYASRTIHVGHFVHQPRWRRRRNDYQGVVGMPQKSELPLYSQPFSPSYFSFSGRLDAIVGQAYSFHHPAIRFETVLTMSFKNPTRRI